jgi:type I restriction enzyme S subunit
LKRVGEKISKVGDVVFTSKGTVGRFAYVNEKSSRFVYSPQLCFWRSLNHSLIFPRFLFYWMQGREFFEQADAVKGQTDMADYVNLSDQRKMKITLPEINEQRAIASVLSSFDDKIDLLHRQNATLEAMAETLFRQWFVEPSKIILNEGAVIEGFENGKFEKWIIETVGGEWGKENIVGDYTRSVYCIRGTDIADLNTGIPLKTPIRFVKETKFRNIEPREGDLIIEISGGTETQSTGRVCYINKGIKGLFNKPLVFSNFCRMIRVRRFEFTYFLYCYIQYLYNQDEFFNLENGSSGIKNLNYKALLFELEYPMPNEELVIKFHDRVESLFKKINQNKTQTITLTALRDNVLPKLISGEVRVKMIN